VKKTLLIAASLALTALAVTATPALASGFTLELTAPPAVVGKPIVMRATGTIPVEDFAYSYWFNLDAIPTSVTTTCPQDRWEGVQFALATGGAVIVLSERESVDAAGHFTIPVAITPTAAGKVLLCGYTDDGLTNTLARASLMLNIAPASLAQELRDCRTKRCARAAIRRAKRGCRQYASHRRQARCLRRVRRIVRQS
jgi:hypothetical protein